MPLIRPITLRTPLVARVGRLATSMRTASFGQRIASRGYASGHGEHKKAGSDLPWLASAIVVTIPACWYLMQPSANSHDAHGAGHGEHGEDEGAHDDSATPAEKMRNVKDSDEGGSDDEDKGEEQKQEVNSEDDSEGSEQSEEQTQSTPENDDQTSQGDSEKKGPDTAKVEDAKSIGKKKYIYSGYGKPQGAKGDKNEDGEEMASSAKEPGGPNSTSGKQDKLSNTQTKHSTDIAGSPDKSTKGEGTPETAKSQGPVKPDRPPAENKEKRGQDKL